MTSLCRGGVFSASSAANATEPAAPAAVVLRPAGAVLTAGEVALVAGLWEIGLARADPGQPRAMAWALRTGTGARAAGW